MKNIYSKKSLFVIRVFSSITIIMLCLINLSILVSDINFSMQYILTLVMNFLSIILFGILILFPTKLESLALVCLINSITCFIIDPGTSGNMMGVILYFLCISIFYSRGVLNKKKTIKKIVIAIIYISLVICSLFRIKSDRHFAALNYLGYTLMCILIIFFIRSYFFDVAENENLKILNLYHYKGLTNRDAQWLNLILEKTKYSAIAINDNMSIGAVKNRIGYIFNVLEVGDKIGFINKYYGYKIIYVNPKEVL